MRTRLSGEWEGGGEGGEHARQFVVGAVWLLLGHLCLKLEGANQPQK